MTDAPLAEAVAVLQAGGVIGLPTETVYGLAANAADEQAVASIYRIKGRPADHPLIVHVVDAQAAQVCGTGRADIGQVGELVQVVAADFGGVHER